jgi:hypothetical protein
MGKHGRRTLSAIEHRQRAQRYRKLAAQNFNSKVIRELMCSAIKHEAIADELEKYACNPNSCNRPDLGEISAGQRADLKEVAASERPSLSLPREGRTLR